MTSHLERCLRILAGQRERVISLQTELTARRGLGPDNNGDGEDAKARYIAEQLASYGVTDILRADAEDDRVPCGFRPNIIARIPGKSPRTLWLFGHTDVVPAGEAALWSGDPWHVRVTDADGNPDPQGGYLMGRGVEDNQQAVVSMLLLAAALHEAGAVPELSLGLVFIADEETGNRFGMEHVLSAHPELFPPEDLYIIPDAGSPAGDLVEVAEKGMLWIHFTVKGQQCHASTPGKGVNAFTAGAALVLALRGLDSLFPERNELFAPAISTFSPTRHDANVPNVNTIPGSDSFYMDCRLIPGVEVEAVMEAVRHICAATAKEYHVDIYPEIVLNHPATPPTPVDAPVVGALLHAVNAEYGVTARPAGIGGGTVAALLRERGIPAAVWARIENTCHAPDERARITSAIGDAKAFARILFEQEKK